MCALSRNEAFISVCYLEVTRVYFVFKSDRKTDPTNSIILDFESLILYSKSNDD
jgi:hypothetical protein